MFAEITFKTISTLFFFFFFFFFFVGLGFRQIGTHTVLMVATTAAVFAIFVDDKDKRVIFIYGFFLQSALVFHHFSSPI